LLNSFVDSLQSVLSQKQKDTISTSFSKFRLSFSTLQKFAKRFIMTDESESGSYSEAESYGDGWGKCETCEENLRPDEEDYDGLCYVCARENALMEEQLDLDISCRMGPIDKLRARLPSHMTVNEVWGPQSKPCSVCRKKDWQPGDDWYVYNHILPKGTIKCCVACADKNLEGDLFQDPMNRIRKLITQLPPDIEIAQVLGAHQKRCSECAKGDWAIGDWYVSNKKNPYGTSKYCLECAENEYQSESEESSGDDSIPPNEKTTNTTDDVARTRKGGTSGQSQGTKRSGVGIVSPFQSPKRKRKT
jgi:hypothetical protein